MVTYEAHVEVTIQTLQKCSHQSQIEHMLWVHFKCVLYVITMKLLGSFNQSSQCSQHVITGSRPPHPQCLYSPSMLINDSPTWRRISPGRNIWSRGRSREYPGGLSSLQTRYCQGQTGPSIKEVRMTGWMMLSGTLTGLGKVRPPIVVRRVVPTRS